jgi:hypothetical protein
VIPSPDEIRTHDIHVGNVTLYNSKSRKGKQYNLDMLWRHDTGFLFFVFGSLHKQDRSKPAAKNTL